MLNFEKKREEADWFFGRQVILEALKSGKAIQKILVAEGSQERQIDELLSIARQKGILIEKVPRKVLNNRFVGNHQGIAFQIRHTEILDFKSFLNQLESSQKTFVTLLDEIQDPGNLGAIIRSAVCFGCSGIVLPKWRSASVTDSVMKSSSGAAVHLPIIQIPNLGVAIERLKENGFFIYGADPEGIPVSSVRFEFPLAIVLGNEHRGIKPIIKKGCDKLVSIPQMKTVTSLNVSNAAAIFFYEIAKVQNLSC